MPSPASPRRSPPSRRIPPICEGLAAAQEASGRRRCGPCHADRRHRGGAGPCAIAQRRGPALGSPARLQRGRAACRGRPDRRSGGRMSVRSEGPCAVEPRPACGSHEVYAEALKLGPDDPMCGIWWLPRASCPARSAHRRVPPRRLRWLRRSLRSAPHLAWLPRSRPDPRRAHPPSGDRRRRTPRPGARSRLRHRAGCCRALRSADRSYHRRRCFTAHAGAAAAKQLYAELREADLMHLLTEDVTCWRLILAADVFCYFGDLRDVLPACTQRLDTKRLVRVFRRGAVAGQRWGGPWQRRVGLAAPGPLRARLDYVRDVALEDGIRRQDTRATRRCATRRTRR